WTLGPMSPDAPTADARAALAVTEAEELAVRLSPSSVHLSDTLATLVTLLRSIGEEREIAIALRVAPDVPPVHADRVALRQVLLGLMNAALERGDGGSLDVSLDLAGPTVEVALVRAPAADRPRSSTPEDPRPSEIEVARRLTSAMGGELQVEASSATGAWRASIRLPGEGRQVLCVLD